MPKGIPNNGKRKFANRPREAPPKVNYTLRVEPDLKKDLKELKPSEAREALTEALKNKRQAILTAFQAKIK